MSVASTVPCPHSRFNELELFDEGVFAVSTGVPRAKTFFLHLAETGIGHYGYVETGAMSESATIHVYYCRNVLCEGELPPAFAGMEANSGVCLEAIPCSGKLDPRYILKAFESGAAAVCVLACPIAICKSMEGSARAGRRVELVKELMAEAGLDPNALGLFRPDALDTRAVNAVTDQVVEFVNSFLQSQQRAATQ